MKTVLITRPKNQALELANFLSQQKIKVFIEPIFVVEELNFGNFGKVSQDFSAIIITSINACFALEKLGFDKNIKIFTIGKKTAEKLQESGFNNIVFSSQNSAESLTAFIAKYQGKILYLRGEKISLDFAKKFENISEIIVYKIHENEEFSKEFLDFCQDNFFDEILLFSQNSAEIFFKLAKKHNLLEYFKGSKIVALSEKISEKVSKFNFSKSETFASNPILKKFYD